MSGLSDEQYLQAWAERADETAFRALVGRYAGFIYGAALRRVGDAGLAEEITQDVFARLSQNAARLVGHPAISGWLHRTAMLLALDRLRRRRRAEHRIAQLSQMNTPSDADPLAEALPHLDEALDQLASRDREVLVLHFFDRLTFPEIATRLGGSADAARMRNNRAISALSATLRKKGVTLSVTALAAGLGGTFAQAAPATLAIIPAALAGAGKVSALSVIIHALQTMKITKAAALTALALVLATPLIFQQQQIAAAEARIADRNRARISQTSALSSSELASREPAATRAAPSRGIDIKALGDAALNGIAGDVQIRNALVRLDANNLVGLIETVMHGGLLPKAREELLGKLLSELGTRNQPLHVEWALKVLTESVPNAAMNEYFGDSIRRGMERSFLLWSEAHPEQAEEWASNHSVEWRTVKGRSLVSVATASLFVLDAERGLANMARMSVPDFCETLDNIASNRRSEADFSRIAKWAAAIGDHKQRWDFLFHTLEMRNDHLFPGSDRPQHILENSDGLLAELRLAEDDLVAVASRLAAVCNGIFNDSDSMTKKAFPWLEKTLPPSRASYAKGGVLLRAFDPDGAYRILAEELDRKHDDELIAGYVESFEGSPWGQEVGKGDHAENAFQLTMRVNDPKRRLSLLATVWRTFNGYSSTVAERARQAAGLTEVEWNKLTSQPSSKKP